MHVSGFRLSDRHVLRRAQIAYTDSRIHRAKRQPEKRGGFTNVQDASWFRLRIQHDGRTVTTGLGLQLDSVSPHTFSLASAACLRHRPAS